MIEEALGSINWLSASNTIMVWILVFVFVIIFGLIAYWLYTITTYTVQVEMIRQVGNPYYIEENGEKKLQINYQSSNKAGKIYQKKLKSGGFKEYFHIKGTNWDYLNMFNDYDFYNRKPNSILDFKKTGIKLFIDKQKGLVPLRLANPGFDYSGITLNEVIGAVTDSLYEREQLFGNDFWTKYGTMITIASLMAFFIIGMIFLIKYQDVFWKNAMSGLSSTIQAVKEVAAPALT